MIKSTKMIATISDLRCDIPFLQKIIDGGVDVVRMNSAHLTEEGFSRIASNVRAVSDMVALLVDTKGAEIRSTTLEGGEPIELTNGSKIDIIADPEAKSSATLLSVNYRHFVRDIPVGTRILIDDGEIELQVQGKTDTVLHCVVLNDGILGSRKSINVPGVRIELPSVSEQDKRAIKYAIDLGMDFIAHSFVRNKADIEAVQAVLDELGGDGIKIIAKIENQEGVDNIDEIIEASDGIMIARGDLGIELAMERIPAVQNLIIHKCILKKKPVIVCTQMLHSMITNPRPTRAEVSDVAGAIFSGTDAVMLSGETAYGKYPVEAVYTMRQIIREAEKHKSYSNNFKPEKGENDVVDVTSYLAKYTVKSIEKLGVKAILNDAATGRTARNLSAYRGKAPIYALCKNPQVARQLVLSYGVFPRVNAANQKHRSYYAESLEILLAEGVLKPDDMVAYIGGTLTHEVGTTSLDLNKVSEAIEFYRKNSRGE
ncbi:pyruvate kinase [Porphyromonadaceae bacterium W3.11]|nr:pyruvate kinase [Porphyromonadaceae bacterium W3.11]